MRLRLAQRVVKVNGGTGADPGGFLGVLSNHIIVLTRRIQTDRPMQTV